MARIQIELPTHFIFSATLTVRVSDLNYGAHLGHDSVLTLMQEARVLFYQSLGFKDEVSFEGSIGQIITDAAIVYKSESFLGDKLLFRIGVNDISKYGFDLYYLVTNEATGKEVAHGKTGIVCFDYSKHKVSAIPGVLRNSLQQPDPNKMI